MLELLDEIRFRNFGHQINYKEYEGDDKATLSLKSAGIEAYSLYCDGKDIRVTLYPFNASRSEESINDLVHIISDIINAYNL